MDYVLAEPAEAGLLLVYAFVMYFTARTKLEVHGAEVRGSWLQRQEPAKEVVGYTFLKVCFAGFLASEFAFPGIPDLADISDVPVPDLAAAGVLVADMAFMLLPHDRLVPWARLLTPSNSERLREYRKQKRLEAKGKLDVELSPTKGLEAWVSDMIQEEARLPKANPNVSKIEIRPATTSDVKYVGDNLCKADFEEFVMTTGRHPSLAFALLTRDTTDMQCGLLNGKPACIFGVVPMPDGTGSPWLLGTDDIAGPAVARALLTHGREQFARWAETYGTLENWVHDPNDLHKKYIALLGATLDDDVMEIGWQRTPLRKFTYVRTNNDCSGPQTASSPIE
jgi:hypothetical protein